MLSANVGSRQPNFVADKIGQQEAGFDFALVSLAVDSERDEHDCGLGNADCGLETAANYQLQISSYPACGRLQRPLGQHGRQMAFVIGRGVNVAHGVNFLLGGVGGGGHAGGRNGLPNE